MLAEWVNCAGDMDGLKRDHNRIINDILALQAENRWEDIVALLFPLEDKVPEQVAAGMDADIRVKTGGADNLSTHRPENIGALDHPQPVPPLCRSFAAGDHVHPVPGAAVITWEIVTVHQAQEVPVILSAPRRSPPLWAIKLLRKENAISPTRVGSYKCWQHFRTFSNYLTFIR
jgi:hypothetical protein